MLQEFTQEVENTARKVMEEIHTAMPGTIVSFSPGSGMAVVQPTGKFTSSSGRRMNYPAISDVPLSIPICQSAGAGIAYPVKGGDSCIIIVSEIELDEWRSGAEADGSLHFDLSSAMAVPGLLVGGGELMQKACAEDAVVIAAGMTEVKVSEDELTAKLGETEIKVTEEEITVTMEDTKLTISKEEVTAVLKETMVKMSEEEITAALKDTMVRVTEEEVNIVLKDAELKASEENILVTMGDTECKVSKEEVAIRGDLKVDGDISYTGALTGG